MKAPRAGLALALGVAALLAPAWAAAEDGSPEEDEAGDAADEADDAKADDEEDAKADDDEKDAKADDDEDERPRRDDEGLTKGLIFPGTRELSVAVGVLGWVGANFIDKPSDQTIPVGGVPLEPDGVPSYPGFSGVTRGFGFALDIRAFEYIGIELDVIPTRDSGKADLKLTLNSAAGSESHSFELKLSSDAWHIPLLVKGILPGELINGVLFLGPEFVIPTGIVDTGPIAQTSGDNPQWQIYDAKADDYIMFTFGLGLEINLPIPTADIKIPISIRGGYNPGIPDKRSERADHLPVNQNPTQIVYRTEWQWEALGTFGLAQHF